MRKFALEDRVVFRESETGEPEVGTITEVIPADEQYVNGGLYIVEFDSGYSSEVWWVELTPLEEEQA